jgi:hypothetical protein
MSDQYRICFRDKDGQRRFLEGGFDDRQQAFEFAAEMTRESGVIYWVAPPGAKEGEAVIPRATRKPVVINEADLPRGSSDSLIAEKLDQAIRQAGPVKPSRWGLYLFIVVVAGMILFFCWQGSNQGGSNQIRQEPGDYPQESGYYR